MNSAPHGGEEFWLGQPDGSLVSVRVFGDEFYQDVESHDGYTLVRGEDGWICYAELSADGSEYVSTGVRYTGTSRAPGSRRGLRVGRNSVVNKQRKAREALGYDELIAPHQPSRPLSKSQAAPDGVSPAPPAEPRVVVGLTLLIDFPDQKSNVSRAAIDDFCNRAGGVNGTNAAGSVYDYYYDVSNGLLKYTNIVTPFVTVDSNKTYYDRGTNYQYVAELIASALGKLRALNFDLSGITTEIAGTGINRREVAVALNIFYAGSPAQGWANGIWPHAGTLRQSSSNTVNGVNFSSYQMSSLGTGNSPPGIGTFVHENGHMVLKWPDLYSYEDHSNGVGNWCVMNSTSNTNPQPPNPYLRDLAGWIDVTPITDATRGVFEHAANGPTAYRYARNAKESYYIEAKRRVGRGASMPGSGLAIWHIHADGKNIDQSRGFPIVALVQADGKKELENKVNSGNAADLFRARHNASFNKLTAPAAVYYDGVLSNIDISEISDTGAVMTFRVGGGAGGPPTYFLSVVNGVGNDGYYEAGTTVDIAAPEQNAAGRAFIRWTSATLTPQDAYASATTVVTVAAEATVTALFARAFALPGAVEADTFGYAQGIAGASDANGATGGRVARIADMSEFAEYVVNVDSGGLYKLAYRLLTSSSSAGAFVLRDATNGVTLDSVAVPASPRTSLQTVQGAAVAIPPGKAVWRIEPKGGNYGIDWFAAEPTIAQVTPVANNAGKAPPAYGVKAAPSGRVSFQIPTDGHVSLKMYDVRGRMVAALCDGVRGSGTYNINISSTRGGLGQGLYIIRMRSGTYAKDVKVHYRR